MRIFRNKYLRVAAVVATILVVTAGCLVYWRAVRALHGSQEELRAEQNLKFAVHPYSPPTDTGFEWVSSPAVFTQAAEFQGHLYICGPAALAEYDERGTSLHEFRVGRELPPSPLVRLVPATLADSRQPELLIATAADGVLAYDGTHFRQIVAEARDARSITTILPLASGHLLIGTQKRGLLVYDGQRLGPYHPTLAKISVTELAGSEADLWIGTQDRGVAHFHGGTADWFDEQNSLPDPHVYGVALNGDRAYVGTAAGVAEFNRGVFVRVLAKGAFVRALLVRGENLLAGTMDDGILQIPLAGSPRKAAQLQAITDVPEVQQIFLSGDTLYAVSSGAVYAKAANAGWKRVLQPESGLLTDRNISALAVEPNGRLWVGYFDRGLDIIEPNQHSRHLEDDHLFCINRIVPHLGRDVTAVATANGLVLFDSQGNKQQVLTRADGLIADHVTDVVRYRDGMVAATPAGLTFLDSDGVRSLYAFHGLVNNHVYAVAARGSQLLAGTLGGASMLQDDQVRMSYTTATSSLKHNWITAAVSTGDDWWLGTYGAGVAHMDANGKFERANGASADLIINPGAMLATDRFVLAGSMGDGLFVMQRASGRWSRITDGLPSLNVTALAAANGFVYVGTDNGLVRIPEQRLGR